MEYFRENVQTLIDQAVRFNPKADAEVLILKDPGLSLYLPDLKALLPPHKLVALVRDPRDVVASMKNVTIRKRERWNLIKTTEELMNYYARIISYQQRNDEDFLVVRYEDLVTGNSAFLLEEFLELPFASSDIQKFKVATIQEHLDPSDPFFSELYLQPTTLEKVGSYTEILTRKEIQHIEGVYSSILRQWNYDVETTVKTKLSRFLRRWAYLLSRTFCS